MDTKMDIELLEACDPLHMPCVLKLEAVESDKVCFEYQHADEELQLNTSIVIKADGEEQKCDTEIHKIDSAREQNDEDFETDSEYDNLEDQPIMSGSDVENCDHLSSEEQTLTLNMTENCLSVENKNNMSPELNINNTLPLEKVTNNEKNSKNTPERNVTQSQKTKTQIKKYNPMYKDKKCIVECKICNLQLTYGSLLRHIKNIHKIPMMYCTYCNFRTRIKQILREHINNIHIKRKFKCKYCKEIFNKYRLFKSHIKMHVSSKNESCKIKKIKIKNKIVTKNTTSKKISCTLCKKICKCKNELKNHLREIHSNLKLSYLQFNQLFIKKTCVKLNKIYDSNTDIKKKELKNVTKCKICNKYIKDTSLEDHIKIHFKYFKCEHCKFNTQDKTQLTIHMKNVHVQIQCKICSFVAESMKHLKIHLVYVHHGKTMRCKYCKFEAENKFRLDCHLKNHHPSKKLSKNKKKHT